MYPFNGNHNDEFKDTFFRKREKYAESLTCKEQIFSVELLSNLLNKMKNGKATGLDDLTWEHLKYSHPIIITILCKLFNLFVLNSHVPESFAREVIWFLYLKRMYVIELLWMIFERFLLVLLYQSCLSMLFLTGWSVSFDI